ncbi:MAG: NAD-dependent epimerase/dehydratase family protein [Pseudomonadota bacterium]
MEIQLLSAIRSHMKACITGASGLVGRHIFRKLLSKGYQVRVLSRNRSCFDIDAELFSGDIRDIDILMSFLSDADVVFHCAAELNDRSSMWDENVNGTKALLNAAMKVGIKRICFLSSAGVTGTCNVKWADESTACSSRDDYEKSKYAAEQIVVKGIPGCSIVILRPTNIVDENKPGTVGLPLRGFLTDRLKAILKC